MELVNVYSQLNAATLHKLYQLLAERKPHQNISHKKMPSWEEHEDFVTSQPYKAWYLIENNKDIKGAIYLTFQNEIGIQLFERAQGCGYGKLALKQLMTLFDGPFYANINPKNKDSIAFFSQFGARHLQNTYIFHE